MLQIIIFEESCTFVSIEGKEVAIVWRIFRVFIGHEGTLKVLSDTFRSLLDLIFNFVAIKDFSLLDLPMSIKAEPFRFHVN